MSLVFFTFSRVEWRPAFFPCSWKPSKRIDGIFLRGLRSNTVAIAGNDPEVLRDRTLFELACTRAPPLCRYFASFERFSTTYYQFSVWGRGWIFFSALQSLWWFIFSFFNTGLHVRGGEFHSTRKDFHALRFVYWIVPERIVDWLNTPLCDMCAL